jgi:hypothetical protein
VAADAFMRTQLGSPGRPSKFPLLRLHTIFAELQYSVFTVGVESSIPKAANGTGSSRATSRPAFYKQLARGTSGLLGNGIQTKTHALSACSCRLEYSKAGV